MKTVMKAAMLLSTIFVASGASAQTSGRATLTSIDGAIIVEGTISKVENGSYIVVTQLGTMTLPMREYFCDGDCPSDVVSSGTTTTSEKASVSANAGTAFSIRGSRTIGTNLMPNLIKAYAESIGATYEIAEVAPAERVITLKKGNEVIAEIDFQTKGSGTAFPALGDGLAEFGMADRRMNDGDLKALAAGGIGDLRDTENEIVLGLDGLVTVVNPGNPLNEISFRDLSRLYSGEAKNWSDVGGPNLPVTLHSWPDGSGDRAIFLSRAVEPFGRTESEAAVEHSEYAEIPAAVLADPGAVGYVGRSFVGTEAKILPIRESCGLVSPPTNFRMKTEGYALSRRIYIYRKPGEIHPIAQEIIDFAFTPKGQEVIVASGFVDSQLETQTLADMTIALDHAKTQPDFDEATYQELVSEMANAKRLSVTFRFEFGRARLDPLSARNVDAFVEKLAAGAFKGREIMVAGFADSVGKASSNKELAFRRAQSVADLIKSGLAGKGTDLKITPVSYGELLPFLCEEDEFGRAANRRVEIWVR